MCVVCRFIPFWDTICDTPHVFLLRILHRFSRLCSGYPAHFLSIYIRAFDCGLTPVSLACVLFVAVPLKESTVLGGTVSRQLTVLPSVIICRSSVGYTSTFWMKVTDIASCLIVLLGEGEDPLGDYLFHEYYYSLSYMEFKHPKSCFLQRTI